MEFFTYRLPNGIRGIHRQVKSNVAHCALVINAGSRDEHPDQYGLAHLTEHAFFKGTTHRKAFHINCRLENLGGELNAYTTKEETVVHATTLRGDFAKAAELIADIVFHSTFPQRELEKEKEVIVDEISDKTLMEKISETAYQKYIYPRHFFGLPADAEIEATYFHFTNEDRSIVVTDPASGEDFLVSETVE